MKMTAGTQDKKKVAILIGLLIVAGAVYLINSNEGPGNGPDPAAIAAGPRPVAPQVAPQRPQASAPETAVRPRTASNQRQLSEFRPSLKPRRPEDRPDPMSVDPTLRLDLLARLQSVNVEAAHRNMFDFSAATPPKPVATAAAKKPPVPSPLLGQEQANAQPATPPPPPPPPKVPLKFYGFISAQTQGARRAFFLDGEDIHVVNEGDVVKRRYRIVRISANSVVVEDLDFKNQQTLPLEEAPAG